MNALSSHATPRSGSRSESRFALQLELRQARLVAEALGLRPYVQVHGLIARLEVWAAQAGNAPFVLDQDELVLAVAALAELPYRRVHGLIGSLQGQLAALEGAA